MRARVVRSIGGDGNGLRVTLHRDESRAAVTRGGEPKYAENVTVGTAEESRMKTVLGLAPSLEDGRRFLPTDGAMQVEERVAPLIRNRRLVWVRSWPCVVIFGESSSCTTLPATVCSPLGTSSVVDMTSPPPTKRDPRWTASAPVCLAYCVLKLLSPAAEIAGPSTLLYSAAKPDCSTHEHGNDEDQDQDVILYETDTS
ncbi:unnamed protein product [Diplocarpon coronariae]